MFSFLFERRAYDRYLHLIPWLQRGNGAGIAPTPIAEAGRHGVAVDRHDTGLARLRPDVLHEQRVLVEHAHSGSLRVDSHTLDGEIGQRLRLNGDRHRPIDVVVLVEFRQHIGEVHEGVERLLAFLVEGRPAHRDHHLLANIQRWHEGCIDPVLRSRATGPALRGDGTGVDGQAGLPRGRFCPVIGHQHVVAQPSPCCRACGCDVQALNRQVGHRVWGRRLHCDHDRVGEVVVLVEFIPDAVEVDEGDNLIVARGGEPLGRQHAHFRTLVRLQMGDISPFPSRCVRIDADGGVEWMSDGARIIDASPQVPHAHREPHLLSFVGLRRRDLEALDHQVGQQRWPHSNRLRSVDVVVVVKLLPGAVVIHEGVEIVTALGHEAIGEEEGDLGHLANFQLRHARPLPGLRSALCRGRAGVEADMRVDGLCDAARMIGAGSPVPHAHRDPGRFAQRRFGRRDCDLLHHQIRQQRRPHADRLHVDVVVVVRFVPDAVVVHEGIERLIALRGEPLDGQHGQRHTLADVQTGDGGPFPGLVAAVRRFCVEADARVGWLEDGAGVVIRRAHVCHHHRDPRRLSSGRLHRGEDYILHHQIRRTHGDCDRPIDVVLLVRLFDDAVKVHEGIDRVITTLKEGRTVDGDVLIAPLTDCRHQGSVNPVRVPTRRRRVIGVDCKVRVGRAGHAPVIVHRHGVREELPRPWAGWMRRDAHHLQVWSAYRDGDGPIDVVVLVHLGQVATKVRESVDHVIATLKEGQAGDGDVLIALRADGRHFGGVDPGWVPTRRRDVVRIDRQIGDGTGDRAGVAHPHGVRHPLPQLRLRWVRRDARDLQVRSAHCDGDGAVDVVLLVDFSDIAIEVHESVDMVSAALKEGRTYNGHILVAPRWYLRHQTSVDPGRVSARRG